jgi:hypothetical protein
MATEEIRIELHAALYKADSGLWVAKGLEYDIIGEGDTDAQAIKHFVAAVCAEFEFAKADHRKLFEGMPRTPPGFLQWWRDRKKTRTTRELSAGDLAAYAPPAWMILAMERDSLVV